MAANMGKNEHKFIEVLSDMVDEIQRKIIEYLKRLQRPTTINHDLNTMERHDLKKETKNGFPWMPPLDDTIVQKKNKIEDLLHHFLNAHYSELFCSNYCGYDCRYNLCLIASEFASRNRRSHVPFAMLCNWSEEFLDLKYVSADIIWKDPLNMTKSTILDICNHIQGHQDTYDAEEGFKFHSYFDGKNMIKAEYGRRIDDEESKAKMLSKEKEKRKNSKWQVDCPSNYIFI